MIAENDENKAKVGKNGILEMIIDILKTSNDENIRFGCVVFLGFASKLAENRKIIKKKLGGIELVKKAKASKEIEDMFMQNYK